MKGEKGERKLFPAVLGKCTCSVRSLEVGGALLLLLHPGLLLLKCT